MIILAHKAHIVSIERMGGTHLFYKVPIYKTILMQSIAHSEF
ncbi:MAG: hypothetical protein PSV35_06890 [bacterium]|nr:hypothetical protein [bacterium]